MDRIEAMKILIRAVEAGSLSRAGRELGLPLATVSRKVAELEAQLGASLLVRSSKGLVPTPAGHGYLTAARGILEQLDEAERAAAGEYVSPRGDLVVSAPVMFGRLHVLPVVIEFLRAYPDVGVTLTLSDRVAHLIEDHLDVALRIGELPDSGLTASRLGSVRRLVCGSPGYFAVRGMPETPNELADHIAISSDSPTVPEVWRLASAGGEIAVPMRSRLGVDTIEGVIDAALAGMGLVRILSYQAVDHVRSGALTIALQAFEPAPAPVQLVHGGHARLPLKLRAFIDFATPRLRQRLGEATL